MISHTTRIAVTATVVGLTLLGIPTHGEPAVRNLTAETALLEHAQLQTGNLARLHRIMRKAKAGDAVTVAVIGGSITQGAKASTPEKRYGNQVAQWWRDTFPKADIHFVNAGIGATGSNYGALRAQRDLLDKKPDFVIVEYGVNDRPTKQCAETLEGLVRQILTDPQQPAIVLLFMVNQHGGNAQSWHGKVGAHYDLPMVSYRDALWPEIEAKRLAWEDISPDTVHPNDLGHTFAAACVIHCLEKALASLPPTTEPDVLLGKLPEPLFSDLFQYTELMEADTLKPVTNTGWERGGTSGIWKHWSSDKPGSQIVFEVSGTLIYLMHYKFRGDMGMATVQVDDLKPMKLDGWFDQTWGGYRNSVEIARNLPPGKHRIVVTLLQEKHPESTGYEFRIMGIGAAGCR